MSKNKMEELLGFGPIERNRIVPGKQPIEGREFCYIADEGQEDFGKIFKKDNSLYFTAYSSKWRGND